MKQSESMSRSENRDDVLPIPKKVSVHRFLIPLALCATGLFALLFGLGSVRLVSHEVYVAVPVREMFATNDFVTPRYGGLPRLEKPPLVYWMAALSSSLFGVVSESTVRLPSVVAALALAIVVGMWAKRWYGAVAGWGAVAAQLTSLYVVVQGRRAEVDMQLCVITTATLFLIGDQPLEETKRAARWRWIAIYLLLSLSWMAKFHYGPAVVLAPSIVYLALRREWRRLRGLLSPAGILIFLAAIVVWPLLILHETPTAFELWKDEAVGRLVGELGRQPIWFYIPCVLIFLLPWTPYALAGAGRSLVHAWRPLWDKGLPGGWQEWLRRVDAGDAREQFLWIWFAVDLAMITLSANKNRQYVLAILPMCSLLVGQQISSLYQRVREGRPLISKPGAVCLSILLVFGVLAAYWKGAIGNDSQPAAVKSLVAIGVVGVLLIVWLFAFRRSVAAVYVAMATYLVCALITFQQILPISAQPPDYAWINHELRDVLSPSQPILTYRLSYHPWYYDAEFPLTRIESDADLSARLQSAHSLNVLVLTRDLDLLELVGKCRTLKVLEPPADPHDDDPQGELCLVELQQSSQ